LQRPDPRTSSARLPARLISFLVAGLSIPAAASAVQVWTASSLEKIRPATAARAAGEVSISAARNEHEAFQVVVTGPAAGVRAAASDLAGPAAITGLRLYRAALIDLRNASALDGGTGPWPDALVPDVDEFVGERRNAFPFDVPAGESRAIWVEVHVPRSAPAGTYRGDVRVTWSGGEARVPVSLRVWPFSLPSTASLKSAFGFSWTGIPAAHGLSAGDAFSRLRARYGELGLDHRVSLSHVDVGDASPDNMARYFGAALDGTAPGSLEGAKLTSFELMGSAASWSPFFATRGWSDQLFQYTCDEPPLTCQWADIPNRARTARAASPAVRTLVTTTIQEADAHGVTSSIDILVPVINYLDDKDGASAFEGDQRSTYDAFLAGAPARELWTYQSCMSHGCGGTVSFGNPSASDRYFTGWPSYMIDASAVRNRAMQWLAFRYRVTGELYFETVMAYSHDPWNDQWDFSGNGDGTLFYPGTPAKIGGATHVPVSSIRLEEIREGMEDYEYLKLVSDLGDPALARSVAAGLFPKPYATEVAPERLLEARARLAARIVELSGGSDPETPPGGDPGTDPGSGGPGTDPGSTPTTPSSAGGCSTGGPGPGGLVALLAPLALALRRRRR
jgi:uncharacterized protein (TIGR03382 family)